MKKLKAFDKPQSLVIKTRQLLKTHELTLPKVADETTIPFYWLKKFSNNEIPNPGVNRVQFLYEFLTSIKLNLE